MSKSDCIHLGIAAMFIVTTWVGATVTIVSLFARKPWRFRDLAARYFVRVSVSESMGIMVVAEEYASTSRFFRSLSLSALAVWLGRFVVRRLMSRLHRITRTRDYD